MNKYQNQSQSLNVCPTIYSLKSFQRDQGLRPDGVMKRGGQTEQWTQLLQAKNLQQSAQKLQSLGRKGDTVLAHITPAEAEMLKHNGGAGTTNPETGLLEFYKSDPKEGRYTWRTSGDAKVRSSHAERDGKVYAWNNPPEGGHPGEALNCRCVAEDVGVDKDECEYLGRLIGSMERNHQMAQDDYTKAVNKFNAAQDALNVLETACNESFHPIPKKIVKPGAKGAAIRGVKGGIKGAIKGAVKYAACKEIIENSPEKAAYEKAKKELDFANSWKKGIEEELKGYRAEYKQRGCIG